MEKARKLPLKVKAGSMDENCINFDTGKSLVEVPWEKVKYICLGIIEESPIDSKGPQMRVQKMIRGVLFGEDDKKSVDHRHPRITYMIDFFTGLDDNVYRIDSSSINYKGFIQEIDYISLNNFIKLARRIFDFAKMCVLNPAFKNYIEGKKHLIVSHPSLYDFELDNYNFIKSQKGKTDSDDSLFQDREYHWCEPVDEAQDEDG